MPDIITYTPFHLDQLAWLVNVHLGAAVPGWRLPPALLAERLERDPGEFVVDPWVAERRTLLAIERDAVVAAAHLQRFHDDERVSEAYSATGNIVWLVAWPSARAAAEQLLEAALAQLDTWRVAREYAFDGGLYVPSLSGVPRSWPHISSLLRAAGFVPDPERTETLYAGCLDTGTVGEPGPPPLDGLTVERSVTDYATRFAAHLGDQIVGWFDVDASGTIPALHGWADPWNLQVVEDRRSQGIGTWLVREAVAWLRLAGCTRVLLPVAIEDEQAGAGRFYRRLGWHPITPLDRGWTLERRA